jgi:hypothetical protein
MAFGPRLYKGVDREFHFADPLNTEVLPGERHTEALQEWLTQMRAEGLVKFDIKTANEAEPDRLQRPVDVPRLPRQTIGRWRTKPLHDNLARPFPHA